MKKLICIIFVFISLASYSQIKVKSSVKLGYESLSYRLDEVWPDKVWTNYMLSPKVSYMGEMGVRFGYKGFEAAMKIHTIFMNKNKDLFSFTPMLAEYITTFKYEFRQVSFNYEHSCTHNVTNPYNYMMINGGYDRIYFEVEF